MPAKLHNIYIFNRRGACLFYKEWYRPRSTLSSNPDEDKKLMFGLLFSLKQLVQKLSPGTAETSMHKFRTGSYTLHLYETPTGYRFVMLSDNDISDLKPQLRQIYSDIFVPYVIKNPLYKLNSPIECELFVTKLEEFVTPFKTKAKASGGAAAIARAMKMG